jgi:hypothetical protein
MTAERIDVQRLIAAEPAAIFRDWSHIDPVDEAMVPVVPEPALRATLGVLDRTVRHRTRAGWSS